MLRLIQEIADSPGFRQNWRRGEANTVFEHPVIGGLYHAANCRVNGEPIYDQPLWIEPIGAICVPYDDTGRLLMLEHFRPALAPVGKIVSFPPKDAESLGRLSLEFPRGFPEKDEPSQDAARREVEEETGLAVLDVHNLGESNTNTSFFSNSNAVCAVKVDTKSPSGRSAEEGEDIVRHRWMSVSDVMEQVAAGSIVCGMTKSALVMYIAFQQTSA